MTASAQTAPSADPFERRLLLATRIGFFVSGATGLIYEVVWLRLLGTIFGSTTLAVSVDLTAFFGGLAIGSYLFGRLGDRWRRLFRAYGAMELGIAALCLTTPFLLALVRNTYLATARHVPFDSPGLLMLQFGLCLLVLVPPTLLMGGTLPLLSRAFTRRLSALGRAVGDIYAINTFGAVLGVFLAGFILLPWIGLRHTIYLAAAFNALVGIAILTLESARERASGAALRQAQGRPTKAGQGHPERSRGAAFEQSEARPSQPVGGGAEPSRGPAGPRALPAVLLIAFGFSGLAGMTLEVAWTRAFFLVIGSTVYAFAIILMAFLAGIAVGSIAFARCWAHRTCGATLFGGVLLGAGAYCILLSDIMGRLPHAFFGIVTAYKDNYPLLLTVESLVVLGLLIVPTMLMGMSFPILGRVYVTEERLVARSLGKAYASNTFGGIVGSCAAGFVFVPFLGVRATILVACGVYLAIGVAVLLAGRARGRSLAVGLAVAALGAVAIGTLPGWEKNLMAAGVYMGRSQSLQDYTEGQVVYYGEGSVCTVAVIREPSDELSLRINGKPDASSTPEDLATEVAGANLPYLLAERHERALVIGLGSGITAGTLLDDGVKHLDVLEIEPHVIAAARWFRNLNYNVTDRPDAHIVVGDGRSYVAATSQTYDIITSEPSNVWVSGMSTLFTIEHFRACRARLRPGGVMCQWMHLYAMGPENLATIIKTFRQVFPGATLWSTYMPNNDVLLIGRKGGAQLDAGLLERRMLANATLLHNLGTQKITRPAQVIGLLTGGPKALSALEAPGAINTDNHPVLEFAAPRYLYLDTASVNSGLISHLRREPLGDLVRFTSEQQRSAEFQLRLGEAEALAYPAAYPWARAQFERVLEMDPPNLFARYDLAQIAKIQGRFAEARRLLRECLAIQPNFAPAHDLLLSLGPE